MTEFDEALMREALAQAHLAAQAGEVPIGAAIGGDGKILARAFNQIESLKDATAHAEMLALREVSKINASWRLSDFTIAVTLEPCIMCIGALRLARIGRIVFGAGDSRFGGIGSICDLSQDSRLGPIPQVERGVLADECAQLLKDFFKQKR